MNWSERTSAKPHASQPATPTRPPSPEPSSFADLGAQGQAVSSAALLQGASVVRIEHNGALYQLRSTRLGKLILTK